MILACNKANQVCWLVWQHKATLCTLPPIKSANLAGLGCVSNRDGGKRWGWEVENWQRTKTENKKRSGQPAKMGVTRPSKMALLSSTKLEINALWGQNQALRNWFENKAIHQNLKHVKVLVLPVGQLKKRGFLLFLPADHKLAIEKKQKKTCGMRVGNKSCVFHLFFHFSPLHFTHFISLMSYVHWEDYKTTKPHEGEKRLQLKLWTLIVLCHKIIRRHDFTTLWSKHNKTSNGLSLGERAYIKKIYVWDLVKVVTKLLGEGSEMKEVFWESISDHF